MNLRITKPKNMMHKKSRLLGRDSCIEIFDILYN
jgi:hypothetical protein